MMRVVITGTGGRLGGAMARRLRSHHRVVAYDRKAMDLRNAALVEDHLGGLEFDVLINCAGVTSLDYCEKHGREAELVNVVAPRNMATLCSARGARFIHFSTDYVYDGTVPGLKDEKAACGPLGVYARTKLAGEAAVLVVSAAHLVLRTCWIFGPDREGHVDQILQRALRGEPCEAIADKWSAASYSHDTADVVARLLEKPEVAGVMNVCNDGVCTWHDLACEALAIGVRLGLPLRTREVRPTALADMRGFLAPRPVHTSMAVEKLAGVLGARPRTWQAALEEYVRTYYGRD